MEITEIGLLAVKAESVYGTDPTPAAANVIPTVGDSITYTVNSTAEDRKSTDGTMDRVPGFNTKTNVTLVFRYELRSSGRPPEIDCLIRAANFTGAGHPIAQYDYTPIMVVTAGPSVSCYWWTGLKLHKLIGGKVNWKLIYEAGKIPIMEFTVMGKYSAVTDVGLPGGVTFLTQKPPLVDGAIITIGGFSPVISKFEFDLGNVITMRPSANDTDSIAGFVITGYAPKGTMDPESGTEAARAWWANWKSSTVEGIFAQVGTTSNGVLLTISNIEAKSVNYAASNNIRIHNVTFNLPRIDLSRPAGDPIGLTFY